VILPHQLTKPSVRLRLTLLYGVLFLISGAVLLAISDLYVMQATTSGFSHVGTAFSSGGLTSQQADALAQRSQAQLAELSNTEIEALLLGSSIALGLMVVVSMMLGWILAGRILEPLRIVTATARRISVTSLDERLSLQGPDDEIKELGDTFDALLSRLETSFQSQRRFIANASHELRTPLSRQRVLAQVAIADPTATVESLRAAHERVLVSGVEQEQLIEGLLTLALSQGGLIRHQQCDLAEVGEGVLAARDGEITRRGLQVAVRMSSARTSGDPIMIERLIANLVDSAMRHNVVGGTVNVGALTRDGRGVFSIANSGPAVPADAVDQLFEPFRRFGADRTSRRDGVGLGLSIVRAIADAHGATIRIQALPEGGLDVEVEFPPPKTIEDRDQVQK